MCRLCRDKRAHLRHEDNERHLPHVGRFTGHVRAGDDGRAAVLTAKQRVVRHEQRVFEHLLDDRMTARRDRYGIAEIDLGLAVMIVNGDGGKAAQHIQLRDGLRRLLDAGGFSRDKLPQRHKQVIFQRHNAVLGRQNGAFQFLQFFRDVPLTGRERLLADIAVRDKIQLTLCNLDIIAEYTVIAHAQIPDAGLFLFTRLDLREHALAAGLDGAQFIELFVCTVTDEPALAQQERRIVHDGCVDLLLEICQRVKLLKKRLQIRRAHAGQPLLDGRQTRRAL